MVDDSNHLKDFPFLDDPFFRLSPAEYINFWKRIHRSPVMAVQYSSQIISKLTKGEGSMHPHSRNTLIRTLDYLTHYIIPFCFSIDRRGALGLALDEFKTNWIVMEKSSEISGMKKSAVECVGRTLLEKRFRVTSTYFETEIHAAVAPTTTVFPSTARLPAWFDAPEDTPVCALFARIRYDCGAPSSQYFPFNDWLQNEANPDRHIPLFVSHLESLSVWQKDQRKGGQQTHQSSQFVDSNVLNVNLDNMKFNDNGDEGNEAQDAARRFDSRHHNMAPSASDQIVKTLDIFGRYYEGVLNVLSTISNGGFDSDVLSSASSIWNQTLSAITFLHQISLQAPITHAEYSSRVLAVIEPLRSWPAAVGRLAAIVSEGIALDALSTFNRAGVRLLTEVPLLLPNGKKTFPQFLSETMMISDLSIASSFGAESLEEWNLASSMPLILLGDSYASDDSRDYLMRLHTPHPPTVSSSRACRISFLHNVMRTFANAQSSDILRLLSEDPSGIRLGTQLVVDDDALEAALLSVIANFRIAAACALVRTDARFAEAVSIAKWFATYPTIEEESLQNAGLEARLFLSSVKLQNNSGHAIDLLSTVSPGPLSPLPILLPPLSVFSIDMQPLTLQAIAKRIGISPSAPVLAPQSSMRIVRFPSLAPPDAPGKLKDQLEKRRIAHQRMIQAKELLKADRQRAIDRNRAEGTAIPPEFLRLAESEYTVDDEDLISFGNCLVLNDVTIPTSSFLSVLTEFCNATSALSSELHDISAKQSLRASLAQKGLRRLPEGQSPKEWVDLDAIAQQTPTIHHTRMGLVGDDATLLQFVWAYVALHRLSHSNASALLLSSGFKLYLLPCGPASQNQTSAFLSQMDPIYSRLIFRPMTVMHPAAFSDSSIPSDLIDQNNNPVGQPEDLWKGNTLDTSTACLAPSMHQPSPDTLQAFLHSNKGGSRFSSDMQNGVPCNAAAIEGMHASLIPPSQLHHKLLTAYVRDSLFIYEAPILEAHLFELREDAADPTVSPSLVAPFLHRLELGGHSVIASNALELAFHSADDRGLKTANFDAPVLSSRVNDPSTLQQAAEYQSSKLMISDLSMKLVADAGHAPHQVDIQNLKSLSVCISTSSVIYPAGVSSAGNQSALPPLATPTREFRKGEDNKFCVRVLTGERAVSAEKISRQNATSNTRNQPSAAQLDAGSAYWMSYRTDEILITASELEGRRKNLLPPIMLDGVLLENSYEAVRVVVCRPGGRGRDALKLPIASFVPCCGL